MQVKNEMDHEKGLVKALESFLLNAHLYNPEQREKIINMLEYLVLPRFEVHGRAPIEEEFLRNKPEVVKVKTTKS